MKDLLNEIEDLSMQERKSLEQMGLKLSEETGECSQALLSYLKANGSEYKALDLCNVQEECIDVILVALSLFYKLGGTNSVLKVITTNKINKWKVKSKIGG